MRYSAPERSIVALLRPRTVSTSSASQAKRGRQSGRCPCLVELGETVIWVRLGDLLWAPSTGAPSRGRMRPALSPEQGRSELWLDVGARGSAFNESRCFRSRTLRRGRFSLSRAGPAGLGLTGSGPLAVPPTLEPEASNSEPQGPMSEQEFKRFRIPESVRRYHICVRRPMGADLADRPKR